MSIHRRTLKSLYIESNGRGRSPKKKTCIDDLVSALVKEGFQSASSAAITSTCANNVLTNVSLFSCSINRKKFSELLRCSPNLDKLRLGRVFFEESSSSSSSSSNTSYFQSNSVKCLIAEGIQVLRLSNAVDRELIDPSLLIHFPNLRTWYLSLNEQNETQLSGLPEQIAVYCPHLEELKFGYAREDAIQYVLGNLSLPRLKRCGFKFCELTRFEELRTLLCHQETLTSIVLNGSIYEGYSDRRQDGGNDGSERLFNKITRSCSGLEVLVARLHTASIEAFEEGGPWACKGLQTLRVMIEGMHDKEEIDTCLKELKKVRNTYAWRHVEEGYHVAKSDAVTLADRVNNQLLRLPRLNTVWLGTTNFFLATK